MLHPKKNGGDNGLTIGFLPSTLDLKKSPLDALRFRHDPDALGVLWRPNHLVARLSNASRCRNGGSNGGHHW